MLGRGDVRRGAIATTDICLPGADSKESWAAPLSLTNRLLNKSIFFSILRGLKNTAAAGSQTARIRPNTQSILIACQSTRFFKRDQVQKKESAAMKSCIREVWYACIHVGENRNALALLVTQSF